MSVLSMSKARAIRGVRNDRPQGAVNAPNEVWLVIDDQGAPVYCAGWAEACQEHVNDAIDADMPGAGHWVVRRFVTAPTTEPTK